MLEPGWDVECDLTPNVQLLLEVEQRKSNRHVEGLRSGAVKNVLRVSDQLHRMLEAELGTSKTEVSRSRSQLSDCLARALLAAFPDRLAIRRSATGGRGLMVGGRGVKLDDASRVKSSRLFLCLDANAGAGEARVRKATAIASEWLLNEHLSYVDERFFHPNQAAVVTRRRLYYLGLLLSETPIETPADEVTARCLARAAAACFERLLPSKDKPLQAWLARLRWLSNCLPEAGLPRLDETQVLEEMIADWCYGLRRLDELKELPWKSLLESTLDSTARRLLAEEAPASFVLPSGREVLLQYELGKPPILAAKIQELFGLYDTPRLAGGRIALLLHLLAPNGRVHQITDDLRSFWTNTYPTVRKELRGRYPKHAWPEEPHSAAGISLGGAKSKNAKG